MNNSDIKPHLVRALLKMSESNKNTVLSADINPENISTYVSVAYESLRQIMEAFGVANKLKVTNHICLSVAVKKILYNFNINDFEIFRQARNSINYYGEKISFSKGKEFIKEMFRMKKEIEKEIIKLL